MAGDFSASAQRLHRAFRSDGARAEAVDHERVRSGVLYILLGKYRSLGADELLDAVDEAMVRLLRESRQRGLENPAGWLVTVATNLARDRLRALDNKDRLAPEPASDDETVRLIDRAASKETLDRGLDEAVRRRDTIGVKVITEWLDLAQETGAAPSSRLVGERCGCSHTTVNQALARFRTYIAE